MPMHNTETVKRAALYTRVSTEEQAMHGESLETQRQRLLEYAKAHEFRVVDLYTDEGVSARKRYSKRGEFVRMLRDVEAGKIDVILFVKLDRWFRNVADYYEVQRILDAHQVDWIATEEQYDTTTANGRFALNIKLAVAQDEADRTSERIRFVFERLKREGRMVTGSAAVGYRIVDKRLAIDEDARSMVEDIFANYEQNTSIKQTSRLIYEQYGRMFDPHQMRHILSNRMYIGENYGIPGLCPALIDRERFERVQQMLKVRAQRNSDTPIDHRVYLFTGLIYCGVCKGRMSAYANGRIYYRCQQHIFHRCTMFRQINQDKLERWLIEHLPEMAYDYNVEIDRRQASAPARKKIDEAAIMGRIGKLKDLYLSDLLPKEMYEEEYRKLSAQLEEARRQTAPPPKKIDIPAMKGMMSAYRDMTEEQKKGVWNITVQRIEVSETGDFSVSLRE